MEELYELCGGTRKIEIGRELTKKFEEHIGNNINDAISFFKDKEINGEITIVLNGANKKKMGPMGEILRIEECPKLLRKLNKMGQNMPHIMDHAPFSEKWGKQIENVPNGGDWGYASYISNLPKMPHSW